MSRTNARFEADNPFTDGFLDIGPEDFVSVGAAGPAIALNASGDVSMNQAASLAAKYVANLSKAIFRTGYTPFLQEQFGTAAGVAGPTAVANTSDPDAQIGVPPFTGVAAVQSGIVPAVGFIPKGIKFLDVTLHYLITGAALTLHTAGLTKTVFPPAGAPAALVISNIIANAANGLATATNANPQTTKIAVANPVFQVADLSKYIIEIDASTQVAGAYRLYGASVHIAYNLA